MKAKITEMLATKFQGVSADVLRRVADKLSKTAKTEEEAQTAVDGVTFQQILESYTDSRVNEALEGAIEKYEKKHGLKNGKPIDNIDPPAPPKPPKKADDDDVPEYIKTLIKSQEAINARLDALDATRVTNSRKSTLQSILKDAPEKLRTRYEKDFSRLTFKDDDDFKAWIEEVTPEVEALTKDFNKPSFATPPMSGGGKPNKPVNPLVQERISEREGKPEASAIQGLSTPTK